MRNTIDSLEKEVIELRKRYIFLKSSNADDYKTKESISKTKDELFLKIIALEEAISILFRKKQD